jgi:hypothetical protein
MRLFAIALIAAFGLAGPAAARDPLTGLVHSFFRYRAPPPPVGGNCGAGAAWFGEFSGKRYLVNDRFRAFSARGCFESELACRVWQQQAITYAFGAISHTSCRPGRFGG